MFKDYKTEGCFKGIKEQHNIMVFIGNGFDISILKKYRNDGLITSYSKFYEFLCYRGFDESNILYSRMKEDKQNNKENWSDFECSLDAVLKEDILHSSALEKSLKEMQSMFLLFLNEIVTPEILFNLNNDTEINGWGKKALAAFLGDLSKEDYRKIKFPQNTYHCHMYNYLFVNFNYTSLFDNYIYFDKYHFEPKPYKTVDRNFTFMPNPNDLDFYGNAKTTWSSYIMTDVIHPHGYQNIPRSLLFGIENEQYKNNRELRRFNKSYWAQDEQKYKSYFKDASLFIIYGTSIGETDSWWWKNIFNCLLSGKSELIIYFYKSGSIEKEDVKRRFISACKIDLLNTEDINKVKEKIYVVLYDESTKHKMLSIKNAEED